MQFSANTINSHNWQSAINVMSHHYNYLPHSIHLCLHKKYHHNKIEEIIHISTSLKCFSINVTYSPAKSGITQNEEADRLAKVGVEAAQKMIKEQEISSAKAPILAVYCIQIYCMQSPSLFQNTFKFCTFLPKFSNIFPSLFLKNCMHVLTF